MVQATTDDVSESGAITRAKMDAALKAKWVEALRSGKYEQGNSELHNSKHNTYCCLGVLCVVAALPVNEENDTVGDAPKGLVVDRYAPLKPLVGFHDLHQFTARNDGGYLPHKGLDAEEMPKHSFAELADYIEANL